jgi:hypothetical protein
VGWGGVGWAGNTILIFTGSRLVRVLTRVNAAVPVTTRSSAGSVWERSYRMSGGRARSHQYFPADLIFLRSISLYYVDRESPTGFPCTCLVVPSLALVAPMDFA